MKISMREGLDPEGASERTSGKFGNSETSDIRDKDVKVILCLMSLFSVLNDKFLLEKKIKPKLLLTLPLSCEQKLQFQILTDLV